MTTGDVPEVRRFDPLSALAARAAVRGEDLAVHDSERMLTFADLLDVVHSVRAGLRGLGVRPGDVVAVSLPNVWQYVALELAVPSIDAILLPLAPRLGRHEIEFALANTEPRLVVVDAESVAAESITGDGRLRVLPVDELPLDATAGEIGPPSTDPARVVEIALTSGTTGLPKLAALTAELKQLTFESFCSRLGIGPGDRMLPMSPISQGVGEICLYALRAGAGVVMTRTRHFDADEVLRLASQSRATVLGGVPTMIGRLLHAPSFADADLGRLRVTAVAGAPLSPSVAREWEHRVPGAICSFYGAMDLGHLCVVRPSDPPKARWTSVGRPHEIADWQICDLDGHPVGPGVVGEVCMRGPLVQPRYWNSDQTPFGDDGWAHFGDLGHVDEDGFLYITGRVKDTIIRGGDKINPYEVEGVLRRHPDVRDVAVVGRPDPDLGERVVAVVVASSGTAPELADLVALLERAGLARYKWPEAVVLIDAVPMGATGKPDRAAMRAAVVAQPFVPERR